MPVSDPVPCLYVQQWFWPVVQETSATQKRPASSQRRRHSLAVSPCGVYLLSGLWFQLLRLPWLCLTWFWLNSILSSVSGSMVLLKYNNGDMQLQAGTGLGRLLSLLCCFLLHRILSCPCLQVPLCVKTVHGSCGHHCHRDCSQANSVETCPSLQDCEIYLQSLSQRPLFSAGLCVALWARDNGMLVWHSEFRLWAPPASST